MAESTTTKASDGRRPLAWSLSKDDWREFAKSAGMPSFRVTQIWQWLHSRRVTSWDEMTNLPAAMRSQLADSFDLSPWTADDFAESPDGVRKLLLECRDGEHIESVIIPSRDHATVCVSTQAGCAFKCAFCATGHCGFDRNLEAGEIVGQYISAVKASPLRISNIVFMGMGEPFANYENTLKAIRIFNDHDGADVGARRMTVSTCGVVPGIRRLADEGLQVELSVSLHAPNDELRSKIMPVNTRHPLSELIPACREYTEETGRIITFEYTLVKDLNDSRAHAIELSRLVHKAHGRVNLIPLSPVEHFKGETPLPEACETFARELERQGINATLRRSKGAGASAACGQLRLSHERSK